MSGANLVFADSQKAEGAPAALRSAGFLSCHHKVGLQGSRTFNEAYSPFIVVNNNVLLSS